MRNIAEITFLVLTAILSQTGHVTGHGRLIHPPQRSSAWRYGFNNWPNYNDNELNCGGFSRQWANDGKCGVCGDPYDAKEKPNEDVDGLYVKNNAITGSYDKGDSMKVQVDITANHRGWFEFRLCPLETPDTKVTQECLNRTLLHEAGGSRTRFYLNSADNKIFEFTLQLPATMFCEKCVLQWKYNTGNSWGCEASGCGIGLGKQENFVNCADIEIRDDGVIPPTTEGTSSSSQSATLSTLTSSTSRQTASSPSSTISPSSSSSTTTFTATQTTTVTMPSSTRAEDDNEQVETTTSSLATTTTTTLSSSTTTFTPIKTTTVTIPSSTRGEDYDDEQVETTTSSSAITTTTTATTGTTTTKKTSSSTSSLETTSSRMTGKVCSSTLMCKPTDAYIIIPGMFNWCCQNCGGFPKFCPPSHCVCERS